MVPVVVLLLCLMLAYVEVSPQLWKGLLGIFFRPYGSQMIHPNNIGDPDFSSNTTLAVLI